MTNALDGLLTGLSLIVVIGAQNAYLLRQGLRRMRVGVIVAICTLSDLALIAAGVSGIGAVVQHIVGGGAQILSLKKIEPMLEDAFVELVGHGLETPEAE